MQIPRALQVAQYDAPGARLEVSLQDCVEDQFCPLLFKRFYLKIWDGKPVFLAVVHIHLSLLSQRESMGSSNRKIFSFINRFFLIVKYPY